nr:uncharacterized protein LOC105713014 [Aotus nancymaae]
MLRDSGLPQGGLATPEEKRTLSVSPSLPTFRICARPPKKYLKPGLGHPQRSAQSAEVGGQGLRLLLSGGCPVHRKPGFLVSPADSSASTGRWALACPERGRKAASPPSKSANSRVAWLVNPLRILGLCHTRVPQHTFPLHCARPSRRLAFGEVDGESFGRLSPYSSASTALVLLPAGGGALLRPRFFCTKCLSLSWWTEGDIIGAARWPGGDGGVPVPQLLLLLGKGGLGLYQHPLGKDPHRPAGILDTHPQLDSRPVAASCHQESPQLRPPPTLSCEKPLLWGRQLQNVGCSGQEGACRAGGWVRLSRCFLQGSAGIRRSCGGSVPGSVALRCNGDGLPPLEHVVCVQVRKWPRKGAVSVAGPVGARGRCGGVGRQQETVGHLGRR